MENTFLCSSMGSPVQLFKSLDFVLFCVINLDFVITSTFQTTASLCSGLSLKEQMFPLFFSAICSVFSQILTSYTVPWLAIIRSLTLNITHEHQPLVTTSKHLSSYFLCTAHLGILFSWSITPPSSFSIDKSVCRGLLHHQEYKSMSSAHPDIPFRLAYVSVSEVLWQVSGTSESTTALGNFRTAHRMHYIGVEMFPYCNLSSPTIYILRYLEILSLGKVIN